MTGELVVMVGPPGAGKSSFAARVWEPTQIVSLDAFRGQCTDDPHDQTATAAAVTMRGIVLEERLRRGLTTVVDSTNSQTAHRIDLALQARRWERPAVAVLFHTPLSTCLARRPWPFPRQVVVDMHTQISADWRHLDAEFGCVVHVAPTGDRAFRVGTFPANAGGRPQWLEQLPALQSSQWLPWAVEYGH